MIVYYAITVPRISVIIETNNDSTSKQPPLLPMPVMGAEPINPGTSKFSDAPVSKPENPVEVSSPSPELHKSVEHER